MKECGIGIKHNSLLKTGDKGRDIPFGSPTLITHYINEQENSDPDTVSSEVSHFPVPEPILTNTERILKMPVLDSIFCSVYIWAHV